MRAVLAAIVALAGCRPAVDIPPGELPCDVAQVICNRCLHCHSDPPQHHAPFPLITWADVDASYGTHDLRVWNRMAQVIEPGAIPHMPPLASPTGQLTQAEADVLRAWFDAGAPPARVGDGCDDCASTVDAAPSPDGGLADAAPPPD